MPPEIEPGTAAPVKEKVLKEIIREVPVFKEFDAEMQLKIGEALLASYRKGWTECSEFFERQMKANQPPAAKKSIWS